MISAKLIACDSGNPYKANEVMAARIFVCYFVVYIICAERITQLLFDALHSFLRTMITERSPQFFRFISRKVGHDHRHFQHLFLKKRYPKRSFQDRNESRVKVSNCFEPLRAGPDKDA